MEGYREGRRVRQRVVANLGRADLLARHAARLLALLRPYLTEPVGALQEAGVREALTYGPGVVARRLWDSLGLPEIVRRHCGEEGAERAFVLVAHRLVHPALAALVGEAGPGAGGAPAAATVVPDPGPVAGGQGGHRAGPVPAAAGPVRAAGGVGVFRPHEHLL